MSEIIEQEQVGESEVSTVYLGPTHHPPFETMIWSGPLATGEPQERYETREEAIEGHKKWCDRVRLAEKS